MKEGFLECTLFERESLDLKKTPEIVGGFTILNSEFNFIARNSGGFSLIYIYRL